LRRGGASHLHLPFTRNIAPTRPFVIEGSLYRIFSRGSIFLAGEGGGKKKGNKKSLLKMLSNGHPSSQAHKVVAIAVGKKMETSAVIKKKSQGLGGGRGLRVKER